MLVATLVFCFAIGFDINPYLRGPSYYPPEWRWSYFFVNTLSRIYLPLLCTLFTIWLFLKTKNKPHLFLLVLLSFFFQLSLLFFSRSGIAVLLHRIINPELNGYFTAALPIQNIFDFLKNYNHDILQFVYHAKAHPPGAILLFYFIKQLLAPFSFFTDFANHLSPAHADVRQTWSALVPLAKTTALFSSFVIPFLAALSLIPLYYSAKILYGEKAAMRSIFLSIFIPSLVFFIPINDAFLHLFSTTAFFFFLKGLQKNNLLSFFFSAVVLFIGVFFNLSLLPILILFFVFALFYLHKNGSKLHSYFKDGLAFSSGFLLSGLFLFFFFQFNFIQVIATIMKYVPHIHTRSYGIWIFYNLYDFLIFCGIPVSIIFLTQLKQSVLRVLKKQWKKIDPLFIAFFA